MTGTKRLAATLLLAAVSFPAPGQALGSDGQEMRAEYDYVIVGGGTSGLVVANRLSEDPGNTVLVIEHGYVVDGASTQIPRAVATPQREGVTWDVTSEPVEGLGQARFRVNMASVLGGGSVINGMFADRGSRADYDSWEKLGNPGWGWDGLLPYFRKSTTFSPPSAELAAEFGVRWDPAAYGDGPVQIAYPSILFPDQKNMTAAWAAHDVPASRAPESGDALGLVWVPNTLEYATGNRSHARKAYYDPVSGRSNLHLMTGQLVHEILFDADLSASGVRTMSRKDNTTRSVRAGKEVILAAGAVNTPKLLQLSGIGPKAVLDAAGISVRVDAPGVGANLQDHAVAFVAWNLTGLAFPNLAELGTNASYNASAWDEYVTKHTGPYTVSQGNAAVFLTLPQLTAGSESLVAEARAQPPSRYLPALYGYAPRLLAGFTAQLAVLLDDYAAGRVGVAEFPVHASAPGPASLQKPLSRGTVSIDAADPRGRPVVQWNTLANPVDRAIMLAMVRYLRVLYEEPILQAYRPVELVPGAGAETDEDLMQALLAAGLLLPTFAHPSCSCAMMPADLGGCVGPDLLVHGTRRLSVVDASVMPLIPAAHLVSTVYAVAEKAADLIKLRA